MIKPRVCYIDAARKPEVGRSALVFTVDHYLQLHGWIKTSKVLNVNGAQFETLNTIYYQAETDESNPPYTSEKSLDKTPPCYDFDVDWRRFVGTAEREHRHA